MTTLPHLRLAALAALAATAALVLAGCGDDGGGDNGEKSVSDADVSACRTIGFVQASLAGPRASTERGLFDAADAAAYTTAIGTVTEAASDESVGDEVATAVAALVDRWSRTRSLIAENTDVDSYNSTSVETALRREVEAFETLVGACPDGSVVADS